MTFNFNSAFKLAGDVFVDLPDMEDSIAVAVTIIDALAAGDMPDVSAAEMAQFKSDMTDLQNIVNDIKNFDNAAARFDHGATTRGVWHADDDRTHVERLGGSHPDIDEPVAEKPAAVDEPVVREPEPPSPLNWAEHRGDRLGDHREVSQDQSLTMASSVEKPAKPAKPTPVTVVNEKPVPVVVEE